MNKRYLVYGLLAALFITFLLFLRTCGDDRNVENVESALLGHWLTNNGTHVFYGPQQSIALSPEGTKSYHPYRVLMSNERESWLKILITDSNGEMRERVMRFTQDRKSFQMALGSALQGSAGGRTATATFVDSKTTP